MRSTRSDRLGTLSSSTFGVVTSLSPRNGYPLRLHHLPSTEDSTVCLRNGRFPDGCAAVPLVSQNQDFPVCEVCLGVIDCLRSFPDLFQTPPNAERLRPRHKVELVTLSLRWRMRLFYSAGLDRRWRPVVRPSARSRRVRREVRMNAAGLGEAAVGEVESHD